MDPATATITPPGRRAANPWPLVCLLLLSVCINYIDRGSLSIAAPVLSDEFSLSPKQLGYLLSAFFWSYTLCQLIAGTLVDRFDVKWVYAGGFLIWSLAMTATGFAHGFFGLIGARLFLGIGESVFLPSASRILVRLFPSERRGTPNAVVDVGTKIGPALSVLLGGVILQHYGWRLLFVTIGAVSLLWLVPWLLLHGTETHVQTVVSAQSEPTLGALLGRKETWGTSFAMFALGYVWIFLITWLPTYLVKQRGFSVGEMTTLGSLPYWAMAVASLGSGWLSDRVIASGHSVTIVRNSFALAGLLTCACLIVPSGFVNDRRMALAMLIASCVALALFTSNIWAITQTLAGPSASGKWTGIQNLIGNLGGVIAPILTGFVVQQTGTFSIAFIVAGGILVVGAATYALLVRKVELLSWPRAGSSGLKPGT